MAAAALTLKEALPNESSWPESPPESPPSAPRKTSNSGSSSSSGSYMPRYLTKLPPSSSSSSLASTDSEDSDLPTFTLEQVSWHDNFDDCWMVIYDKVYDITDIVSRFDNNGRGTPQFRHPGGDDVLWEYAGRDATLAFRGVGHSKAALLALDDYCIGMLVESERLFL